MTAKEILKKIIPQKYHFWGAEIKNLLFTGYSKRYYSQFGEDIVISKLVKAKGFYVDVGAHHPFRYSNTYLLFKQGWRGINVEPNSYAIKLFNLFRRQDINLEIGVAGEEGEMTYYYFSDPAFNTLSDDQAKEALLENKWLKLRKKVSLPVLTLKTIFERHLPAKTEIDFLNIDVEGLDLIVLQSNDWTRFKPLVVSVEASDFDITSPKDNKVFAFMSDLGYELKSRVGFSLIFSLAKK